ncbi:MAG: hypothetical protein R6W78_04240 [Bacteroidales bacterium]
MKDNILLTGNWLGELTYNDDHRPELQGKTMKFRLAIEENDGDITGECIDLEGTGVIPEAAVINGFFDENVISFVKQYPGFYFINYNAEVEKHEDKEPAEINFTGTFNPENNQFEGEWHAVFAVKQLIFGFAEQLISGTWIIKRSE